MHTFMVCSLLLAEVALAQTTAPATSPHQSAHDPVGVSQALDYWVGNTEKQVVPAADAMPEEKYAFAPRGAGFDGVRTFGEQVKHLAANNYRMAANILGETPTSDQESETGPDSVRSKAQINLLQPRGSVHRAPRDAHLTQRSTALLAGS
jgi:hypothetical protein